MRVRQLLPARRRRRRRRHPPSFFSAVKNFFVTVELLPPSFPPATESARLGAQQSVSGEGAKTLSGDLRSEEREAEERRTLANANPVGGEEASGGYQSQPLPDPEAEESPRLLFCNPQRRRRPRPRSCQPTLLPPLVVFVQPCRAEGDFVANSFEAFFEFHSQMWESLGSMSVPRPTDKAEARGMC